MLPQHNRPIPAKYLLVLRSCPSGSLVLAGSVRLFVLSLLPLPLPLLLLLLALLFVSLLLFLRRGACLMPDDLSLSLSLSLARSLFVPSGTKRKGRLGFAFCLADFLPRSPRSVRRQVMEKHPSVCRPLLV